jgi:hypothetical protein
MAITVNIIHPGVTRTEHVESWFGGMARAEGITLEAVIKREAGDPAAIRRMLEVEEVTDCICFWRPSEPVGSRVSPSRWMGDSRERCACKAARLLRAQDCCGSASKANSSSSHPRLPPAV